MKLREWLEYKKTYTRKELLKFAFCCSIPFGVGLIAIIIVLIFKPHRENGRWKID